MSHTPSHTFFPPHTRLFALSTPSPVLDVAHTFCGHLHRCCIFSVPFACCRSSSSSPSPLPPRSFSQSTTQFPKWWCLSNERVPPQQPLVSCVQLSHHAYHRQAELFRTCNHSRVISIRCQLYHSHNLLSHNINPSSQNVNNSSSKLTNRQNSPSWFPHAAGKQRKQCKQCEQ